jgi:hypothetical protein
MTDRRHTPQVHAIGEMTGAGNFRSLCAAGLVTGPNRMKGGAVPDLGLVSCQRCLDRAERLSPV